MSPDNPTTVSFAAVKLFAFSAQVYPIVRVREQVQVQPHTLSVDQQLLAADNPHRPPLTAETVYVPGVKPENAYPPSLPVTA